MGVFGFLSKAHLDQAVPSGDVQAQVQIFDDKGVEMNRTRIDFRLNDAAVTKTIGDKITKSTVAIDPKAEIRDLTEFWFIRDEPEKGKAFQYLTFDSTALSWQPTKSTFFKPHFSDALLEMWKYCLTSE